MFVLRSFVIGVPLLSLRTGGAIGNTTEEIINPNNLKIEGFYCDDKFSGEQRILLNQDVRESSAQGIIIDDHDVLADPADLVRLKKILQINFELIGKQVVTETKNKIGKVEDYSLDSKSLYIQKLYVSRSMFKSLGTGQLQIDRNNIIEITDRKVIIKDIMPPKGIRAAVGAAVGN